MKQIVNIDLKAAELFISAAEMEQSYKKAPEYRDWETDRKSVV